MCFTPPTPSNLIKEYFFHFVSIWVLKVGTGQMFHSVSSTEVITCLLTYFLCASALLVFGICKLSKSDRVCVLQELTV